jgi:hypothetical protein
MYCHFPTVIQLDGLCVQAFQTGIAVGDDCVSRWSGWN